MALSAADLNSLVAAQYLSGECFIRPISMAGLRTYGTSSLAVAVTLTLYDRLLVLEKELELIWRQPWTVMSILVLIDMYGRQASMLFIGYGA